MLQLPSAYVFTGVIHDGKSEEFFDESRRLCDLLLFLPVLQLAEPLGNLAEKRLNHEISN